MSVKLETTLALFALLAVTVPLCAQTPASPVPPGAAAPALPTPATAIQVPTPLPAPAYPFGFNVVEPVNWNQRVVSSPLVGDVVLNAWSRGVWWHDEAMVSSLGLTMAQQRKMDEIFQQYRLQLIDLNAALDKEELILEPLVAAETLDEARIVAQIDKVAAARAELEKANARLLLGLQQTLTVEQRAKLPRSGRAPSLRPGTRF